ncbi:hypothetical protein BU14_0131s0009 [Porphyra umbilicalis]|uniref:Uncharacterized protein n=1 Tax=Porphyra umbilicalis TaxID=2786 RepID=A0A1X6PAR5_PORUM|nr:hypothetical protein BU14_0131s0009 [Porphyra umbilicalis]|eukprot:OSX77826.1 hypothetical protein BU14_0131s0009 [Porphyra umbilicalis]
MLVLDLWVQFTAKELSRQSANQQLSIANAAAWMVTRPEIKNLSFTIKRAAIKSIIDGIKTYVVERRSIGRQTGDGTMDLDVDAERARMDHAKAKSWHIKRSALTELLQKATEVLGHTGETSKTRPLTCGSARGRRSGRRATTNPPAGNDEADKDSDGSESSTSVRSSSPHPKASDSDIGDIEDGELPARLDPRPLVASRRTSQPTATASAAEDRPSTAADRPPQATERTLPRPSSRGGASGRSSRMSAAEQEGHAALGAGDALAMVMREGFAASAAVAEKKAAVDVEARRVQEAAAERRTAEEAAKAARQMDLDERRQSAEQAVAERSVAVEERNASVADKRVNLEAMLARVEVYKKQLDIFGKMHSETPSAELVSAAKDATEAFNRAGGASVSTGELGGGGGRSRAV